MRPTLFAVALFACAPGCAPTGDPRLTAAPPPAPVAGYTGPPLELAPPPRAAEVAHTRSLERIRGTVLQLHPDSLLIHDADARVRVFDAGPWLGSPRCRYMDRYRLIDLEVGDSVTFGCERVGGRDVANSLCIRRRPGGRVPPQPYDPPGWEKAWHMQANAEQDHEEKGTPLPDWMTRVPGMLNGRMMLHLVPPGTVPKAVRPRKPNVPPVERH